VCIFQKFGEKKEKSSIGNILHFLSKILLLISPKNIVSYGEKNYFQKGEEKIFFEKINTPVLQLNEKN